MSTTLIKLLQNQIDLTRVPFSERGSRLLVHKYAKRHCLYVKLAERLTCVQPGLEAYFHRPPFIEGLSLIDQNGIPLEFELSTSAELIQLQTRIGVFRLAFQDANTLAFGLPPNAACGLRFQVRELKDVRKLSYATNGEIVTESRQSVTQDSSVIECVVQANDDCALTLHISDQEHLAHQVRPFSETRRKAGERWGRWYDQVPRVAQPYRQKYAYAWWVMANNLVSPLGFVTREAMMPSKSFYVGLWLWDSALHAIALRHAEPELARDQLRVMLEHQLPDGMLPDTIFDEGVVSELDHPIRGKVTKPPILAWAALKVHESHPDMEFLREIYHPLVKCNTWWLEMNDDDADGLVQYSHPYSSGLDNSPLFDHGMPVESPDINTYLSVQMDCLAVMADELGKTSEAALWRERSQTLVRRMIEDLWDGKAGVFQTLYKEQPIPVLTPFNLYPLWTGRLPPEITERLILHLKNPDEFWGDYVLPSVARNDPAYTPEGMWRGPVWANINYFFIEALQKAGEAELARQLRHKTLELIMSQAGIHEYYNPENGRPPASAASMFGWTAAVFIELALQATADEDEPSAHE